MNEDNSEKMIANILTIAGSDSGGGAGIQADLKTIAALECYGLSVITSVTAQNTRGVRDVHAIPPAMVMQQLDAVFEDIRIDAVKIGMVGSPEIVRVIVDALQRYKPAHVVVDPVMISQSGDRLSDDKTIEAIKHFLVPMATVLTPNIPEAEELLGQKFRDNWEGFGPALLTLEPRAVYLKGGHLQGETCKDLYIDRDDKVFLEEERVNTQNTHGTGCTLSSALAVYLAKGLPGPEAAKAAKKYVTGALSHAEDLHVGKGQGPLHHFFAHWYKPVV